MTRSTTAQWWYWSGVVHVSLLWHIQGKPEESLWWKEMTALEESLNKEWNGKRLESCVALRCLYIYTPMQYRTHRNTHTHTNITCTSCTFFAGRCICLSVYLSIYRSIYLSIYRSIDLSIYRSIDLSIYRSIDLSIYRSIDLSIYRSIDLSNYLSIYPSIYLSIHLSIYLSNRRRHMYSGWYIDVRNPELCRVCFRGLAKHITELNS